MEAQLEIIKSRFSKISKGIWLCSQVSLLSALTDPCLAWRISLWTGECSLGEVEYRTTVFYKYKLVAKKPVIQHA